MFCIELHLMHFQFMYLFYLCFKISCPAVLGLSINQCTTLFLFSQFRHQHELFIFTPLCSFAANYTLQLYTVAVGTCSHRLFYLINALQLCTNYIQLY